MLESSIDLLIEIVANVIAGIILHFICKWLDRNDN